MLGETNPEDDKYLASLQNLLKISENAEKHEEKEKPPESEGKESVESEKLAEIPGEQMIEPAERIEPLKSIVEPEYVRKVIREMDIMSTEQLKQALKKIKVAAGGNKKTLRKKVAQYYRKENSLLNRKLEPNSDKTLRYFDYLIAIDFECTCVEILYDYPHEIIELPAVLIDVREMKIISEFRTYVRPVRNPVLSDFCIQFTKIAQETVDNAPFFREALERLYTWMRKYGLGEKNTRFAFVTDGPHDMWKFMQFQCLLSNIRMPHMFRSFINIKKTFIERFHGLVKGNGKSGIENMLERLQLSFVGNKHSGLDDARNIAAIAIQMMKLKFELRINQKCSYRDGGKGALNAIKKEHQEQMEEEVDLQSIDISSRDFQLWMRRLPLKLSSITRREFINEEYLDCESCDDLTDEKTDQWSILTNSKYREETSQELDEIFEKIGEKNGKFVIGEISPATPPKNAPKLRSDVIDDSDDEDYGPEFDMLDLENLAASASPPEDIELDTIWQRNATLNEHSSMERDFPEPTDPLSSAPPTSLSHSSYVLGTSSTEISTPNQNRTQDAFSPPPRNSLISRHY